MTGAGFRYVYTGPNSREEALPDYRGPSYTATTDGSLHTLFALGLYAEAATGGVGAGGVGGGGAIP